MIIKIVSLLVILVSFLSKFRNSRSKFSSQCDVLQHVAFSVPVNDFDGYFYEKPGISLGFNENDIGLGVNNDDPNNTEIEDVCTPCCEKGNLDHDLGSQCDDCVCLTPPLTYQKDLLKTLGG